MVVGRSIFVICWLKRRYQLVLVKPRLWKVLLISAWVDTKLLKISWLENTSLPKSFQIRVYLKSLNHLSIRIIFLYRISIQRPGGLFAFKSHLIISVDVLSLTLINVSSLTYSLGLGLTIITCYIDKVLIMVKKFRRLMAVVNTLINILRLAFVPQVMRTLVQLLSFDLLILARGFCSIL